MLMLCRPAGPYLAHVGETQFSAGVCLLFLLVHYSVKVCVASNVSRNKDKDTGFKTQEMI